MDANHLRLLEIGFYISGVMTAFRFIWFGLMAALFSVAGITTALAAVRHKSGASDNVPPQMFFFIFALVFGIILFLIFVFAALEIYAGICLKNRRHPVLIQIVAGLYCLSIPWGTALGVFTFMVLNRPTVKPLFAPN